MQILGGKNVGICLAAQGKWVHQKIIHTNSYKLKIWFLTNYRPAKKCNG